MLRTLFCFFLFGFVTICGLQQNQTSTKGNNTSFENPVLARQSYQSGLSKG
jgi:hypothetical protein